MAKHYYGNGKPVNVFRNQAKLAGYHTETKSGDSVSFADTYNDIADVELTGNTVQMSDWYAKDGLSSQVVTVQGKNLFDVNKAIIGYSVFIETGGIASSTTRIVSDYIKIAPSTAYTRSVKTPYTLMWLGYYDANKQYISYEASPTISIFTTPSNAAFVRMSFQKTSGVSEADRNILGESAQLELGSTATPFVPFTPNSPSPEYPSPVTSNLPAGTYKYTSTDGVYEFTISEELRGIGTAVDKVVFDRKSHRGIIEKRIGKVTLNGSETYVVSGSAIDGNNAIRFSCVKSGIAYGANDEIVRVKSDKLLGSKHASLWLGLEGVSLENGSNSISIRCNAIKNMTVAEVKMWLASNNIACYCWMISPTRTPITFTKVSSSSAPECPMTFLTNTPSLDYPAQVYDVNGNILSNGEIISALPTLRKVGTVADSFVPKTGVLTNRVSDWVSFNNISEFRNDPDKNGYKRLYVLGSLLPNSINNYTNFLADVYKNDSTPIAKIAYGTGADQFYFGGSVFQLTVSDTDSGIGETLVPTSAEWKAYFYGWKMCNADGTTPYYKSEAPYTPSTWAEWTKSAGGVVVDSTGLTFTGDGITTFSMQMITAIKNSTKYGFLYNIVFSTVPTGLFVSNASGRPFSGALGKAVGNNKLVLTSASSITFNNVFISLWSKDTGSIKIKDIRIFELPAGSQIEADFDTLTADQLAAKYTFNGLCPKNWKHIVGNQADINASKTAVLPTATYTGYTPYKMLYQLATPLEESYAPAPVPTHLGQTIISTDSIVKPTITATVKVPD